MLSWILPVLGLIIIIISLWGALKLLDYSNLSICSMGATLLISGRDLNKYLKENPN
ncbi:MAG: hypothetical protein ACJASQ_000238 [Crocinitomicaceae bacterium]|jgi:hypothetical protein